TAARRQQLQRDALTELEVVGAVHFAGRTAAEQADDPVAGREDPAGRESRVTERLNLGHAHPALAVEPRDRRVTVGGGPGVGVRTRLVRLHPLSPVSRGAGLIGQAAARPCATVTSDTVPPRRGALMRTSVLLVPLSMLIVAAWIVTAPAQTPASTVTIFEGARIIAGDGRAPLENASFI